MAVSTISEHDQRQLSRMFERLEMFEKEKISLGVLISDIEFLLGALEAIDHRMKQSLRERWCVLEEIYSVARVMKAGRLSPDDESAIRDTVKMLQARVAEIAGM